MSERTEQILFETRKKLKLADVDRMRLRKTFTDVDVTFPGGKKTVQFRDERDMSNLLSVAVAGIALAAGGKATDPLVYRTKDNENQNVKAAEMVAIGMEVMAKKQAVVSAAWAHKDAIKALNTVGEVEAYDITTGWPE